MSRRQDLLTVRPLPKRLQYSPENLRELLETAGLTRAEAAELLGVSLRSIERYLSGAGDRRHMSGPAYEMLLLRLDRHPFYRLVPTASASDD